MDARGRWVDPFASRGARATVLLFVMTDCPIANGYAPEIDRLAAQYGPRRISFSLVYVDPELSAAAARRHARDYRLRCGAILDPRHTLAARVGATISPEAVVIGADHHILYRGRIDDRAVAFGKVRLHPTRRELRDALDALLHGAPIPIATTISIGCLIPQSVSPRR